MKQVENGDLRGFIKENEKALLTALMQATVNAVQATFGGEREGALAFIDIAETLVAILEECGASKPEDVFDSTAWEAGF